MKEKQTYTPEEVAQIATSYYLFQTASGDAFSTQERCSTEIPENVRVHLGVPDLTGLVDKGEPVKPRRRGFSPVIHE